MSRYCNIVRRKTVTVGSADKFKLQFGTIIYFAVDYDATDAEITNLILPYIMNNLYEKTITLIGYDGFNEGQ